VAPLDLEHGHVALGLALRHLGNTGIFMMATAHPDDENNGLLVMLNRGQGYRTALATATRGNGGQNEIGPELFEALGVLRTEELHAIHRFDGAEQYFTRAVDFGFSFSIEETYEKWGRDEIIADYVRLIRTIRPDVITALTPTGNGGGQHHQASALLAREAFRAAGDPRRFPDQIAAGLRPWRPRKFYFAANVGYGRGGAPATGQLNVDIGTYDPLLGRTWAEIGSEARSMHKCQGTDQLLWLPGPATAGFSLAESTLGPVTRPESSLFDGIDTSVAGLAQLASPRAPNDLVAGLEAIATSVQTAQMRFSTETDGATVAPLLAGLRATRALRAAIPAMPMAATSKYEINFRLAQKEREFQHAVVLASRLRIEALADDQVVVAGQPVGLSLIVANRGVEEVVVKQTTFNGFDEVAACELTPVVARGRGAPPAPAPVAPLSSVRPSIAAQCTVKATVPQSARVTEPYWHRAGEAGRYTFDPDAPFGLPYRPTPFRVSLVLSIGGGDDVAVDLPMQARYQADVFSGEKRGDLLVVPATSVTVSPQIAIIPKPAVRQARASAGADTREIRVMVVNDTRGPLSTPVRLEVPAGWSVSPASQTVEFTREDESQTVRFTLTVPAGAPIGDATVRVLTTAGSAPAAPVRGFQKIEYPHIRRQHVYRDAEARVKVMDVKVAPNLTVGYIMGVGDEVPGAISQLGARLELIDAETLTYGDLSRFSTIVTGVRAYERREDLRANNSRLLEYVRNGGTVLVQYNKFEFNDAQYGPYPAQVSNNRATDENASVTTLAANDPVFNVPNLVNDATWLGWVQERGLYFLGEKDARYRDLVVIDERFPNNAGPKRGALVATTYGRGRWVYVGLNLWRQLPAGVDGAYPLLANLISLGH
jgi:LmbE family N-acetylglucosaminyl deacetylase